MAGHDPLPALSLNSGLQPPQNSWKSHPVFETLNHPKSVRQHPFLFLITGTFQWLSRPIPRNKIKWDSWKPANACPGPKIEGHKISGRPRGEQVPSQHFQYCRPCDERWANSERDRHGPGGAHALPCVLVFRDIGKLLSKSTAWDRLKTSWSAVDQLHQKNPDTENAREFRGELGAVQDAGFPLLPIDKASFLWHCIEQPTIFECNWSAFISKVSKRQLNVHE